jgi:hypothetical protein
MAVLFLGEFIMLFTKTTDPTLIKFLDLTRKGAIRSDAGFSLLCQTNRLSNVMFYYGWLLSFPPPAAPHPLPPTPPKQIFGHQPEESGVALRLRVASWVYDWPLRGRNWPRGSRLATGDQIFTTSVACIGNITPSNHDSSVPVLPLTKEEQ